MQVKYKNLKIILEDCTRVNVFSYIPSPGCSCIFSSNDNLKHMFRISRKKVEKYLIISQYTVNIHKEATSYVVESFMTFILCKLSAAL